MNLPDPQSLPLRDIHLPPPVPWWPLAPGWWVLAGSVLVAIVLAWWAWRRHAGRRLRRAALAEIDAIEARFTGDGESHACACALSRLAHRMTLAARGPRAAAATGANWVATLEDMAASPLPDALRELLTRAPYSPAAAAAAPRERYAELAAYLRGLAGTLPPHAAGGAQAGRDPGPGRGHDNGTNADTNGGTTRDDGGAPVTRRGPGDGGPPGSLRGADTEPAVPPRGATGADEAGAKVPAATSLESRRV
jgi:hypothetical protein